MAAPYNDLESKLEAAMKAVFEAAAVVAPSDNEEGLIIATGLSFDDIGVPNVVFSCESVGEEAVKGTGIFYCRGSVSVASHAKDATLAGHRDRVAKARDIFLDSAIAATLSAALSDFHCYDVRKHEMRRDIEQREKVGAVVRNTLSFEAVCCGSDIS